MPFPIPPESWDDKRSPEMWRLLSTSIRGLLHGKSNNTLNATLTADATSTVVELEFVTAETNVQITPKTANAASSLSNVYAVSSVGKVTINHDSSSQTARTYGLVFSG